MKLEKILKKIGVPALCALAPFAAADYEKFLPVGETLAVFKIENLETLKKHAARDAFASELKEKIFLPAARREASADSGNFATLLSEELAPARGEVLFAAISEADADVAVVEIFDCGNAFTLDDAAEVHRRQAALINEAPVLEDCEILGVPAKKAAFGKDEAVRGAIAVIDGKYFISSSVPALEKIIRAVKDGNARGLSASAVFAAARERMGDADAWFYADGAAIAKRAYALAAAYDRENAEKIEKHPETAFLTISATSVVKALAPEALTAFWGKLGFSEAAGFSAETTLSWKEAKGLVTLITGTLKNGIEKPEMFPRLEGTAGFAMSGFSLGAALLNSMEIARRATPLFGFAEMQLTNLKTSHGLDIPAALGAFDNGFAVYSSVSPEAQTKLLIAQKVSDGARVLDAVRKTAEMLGCGGDPVEVCAAGTPTVYAFRDEGGNGGDAENSGARFALVDGWFCLGEKDLLNRLVERSRGGSAAAESVWDDSSLKAGEALLPAGGCGISRLYVGKTFAAVVGMLGELGGVPEISAEIDPARDLDYCLVSKMYLGEKELSSETVVVPNGGNAAPERR